MLCSDVVFIQVRGLDGIDAEWITEREFLKDTPLPQDKKLSNTDEDIVKMDHLEPVMFYVHGGGYYFGSISEYL
jgi:acetyl esterase/lipase